MVGSVVYAEGDAGVTEVKSGCRELLGMVSWDCHVNLQPENQEQLTAMIAQIATNILTDLTAIAAYIALGYVVYGGYKYMFSYGDPSKVALGKKTLTQAFIGLAIVMLSSVIFSAIRIALAANGASYGEIDGMKLPNVNVEEMVLSAFSWFTSMGGIVAAVFLVYGGVSYMTSAGDAGKLTKAKNSIIYSLIGLAIVGLSAVILNFVSIKINEAKDSDASAYIVEGSKGELI